MEKGITYEVYYKDDTQTRHKTLVFEAQDLNFLYFTNSRSGEEEIIPVTKVVRITRKKDERKTEHISG